MSRSFERIVHSYSAGPKPLATVTDDNDVYRS